VSGRATASEGASFGVYGESAADVGRGVYGIVTATDGFGYGVFGENPSPYGTGVHGCATSAQGHTRGVWGRTQSTDGYGVYGDATCGSGTTYGVYGTSVSSAGRGVYGHGAVGVAGHSDHTSGTAVYGYAESSEGTTYGVFARSSSTSGLGVYGWASGTVGVTFGVYGVAWSTSGYGVYCAGNFVASGTKSCVVKTSKGPTLMYCQESPESWFEDFGEGQLASGKAHIELDPVFLETATVDEANPMHVFVQLHDPDCEGVAVQRGETGFDVLELKGGTSGASFSYRVVAKRKGFETKRLDVCEAARTDSYVYPELRHVKGEESELRH